MCFNCADFQDNNSMLRAPSQEPQHQNLGGFPGAPLTGLPASHLYDYQRPIMALSDLREILENLRTRRHCVGFVILQAIA